MSEPAQRLGADGATASVVREIHVAMATGYASASRFAARFRARFGYLPTDVRGENRGRGRSHGSKPRPR